MGLTVAIVGRPNVGKSTLFNRLVGRRTALVDDTPGMTRDWRRGAAEIGGLAFTVIDTAGLEEAAADSLADRMTRGTTAALARADVALFLIDARAGVTPADHHFAALLRAGTTPILLVANKAEGRLGTAGAYEAFELGLGDPIAISAEHGEGMADLVEALLPFAPTDEGGDAECGLSAVRGAPPPRPPQGGSPPLTPTNGVQGATPGGGCRGATPPDLGGASLQNDDLSARPIDLAIVGRPNVGKSTLVNALLGEDRMLTGPEAGMTRDAIRTDWVWQDRPVRLVDTAGLRRRARVDDRLEKLAVGDALGAIRLATTVILVLDATIGLDRQDLAIARLVLDEGRALVIALNKWDVVAVPADALGGVKDRLQTSLPQARGVALVTVSALTGRRLDALMAAVVDTDRRWNLRVSTGQLNRWLAEMTDRHPPPLVDGRRVKLRYMTQVKARPPTFAVWSSQTAGLPEDYRRYLTQGLRAAFDLAGVPIRLLVRKGANPYDPDGGRGRRRG